MPQRSAGILLYRSTGSGPEVLLIHPGGPFWAKKDDGAWSIPKGLYEDPEDPLVAAGREFEEETGLPFVGEATLLGEFKQPGGKLVTAFTAEGDFDLSEFRSNTFTLEWPPKSGRRQEFPEADRAGWFTPMDARRKMLKGQLSILEALLERLGKR